MRVYIMIAINVTEVKKASLCTCVSLPPSFLCTEVLALRNRYCKQLNQASENLSDLIMNKHNNMLFQYRKYPQCLKSTNII